MEECKSSPNRSHLPFAQHHAFIIGINAYQKLSKLQTAADDAKRLADVLEAQHGFTVTRLLDARGDEIRALLQTTLGGPSCAVGADDRVVFYFAGHGFADTGDQPEGYLIPADADPEDHHTFIRMAELQEALTKLPCRHLLLILDCCFAGAFKWSSQYRDFAGFVPKVIYKERFDRFVKDPAWQVITSAAYDQKALDVVRGLGKVTGDRGVAESGDGIAHSPFAKALLGGLAGAADGKGDREGDGVITANKLYAYIRDEVEVKTIAQNQEQRQTPGYFTLKKHDKGEFIFLKPNHLLNLPAYPSASPYKGLASFDEKDRLLFYGRDRVIKELRAKAEENRLLVVSGASGAGKSSVIKAGLLPLLAEQCRILPVIRPGEHPLEALEQALKQAQPGEVQKTILVIDQFEEVITRCADRDERRRFDERLGQLLDDKSIDRLILTVRADFEPQLDGGKLKADWMAGRYTVPPFSLEELKEVIVMPTIQQVLIFDPPELVDQIIDEVVQSPGALPLLSYALSELYEAYRTSGRQDRALKKTDYDESGGVAGALTKKADALYDGLQEDEREMMRRIMLRMVSVDGDLASKRAPMRDLVYQGPLGNALVDQVLGKMVEARLIVKGADFIEPAHDALVRAWKRLHDWVDAAGRDKLILGAKLGAAANDFMQSKDKGALWDNHPYLPVVEKELNRERPWFNAKEIDFVKQSVERKDDKLRAAEAEKVRVLLSLFSSLDLHLTTGQPGSVSVAPPWIAISRLPAEIRSDGPAVSRDFIVARHHGAGRVLVYAHDALTKDEEIERGSDNLVFAENALRWLAPSSRAGNNILFWEGTYLTKSDLSKVTAFIKRRRWSLKVTTPETLEADLGRAGILWYASDWDPPADFAARHVPLIERFVSEGGGLLVGGLGWSYWQNAQGTPPPPYAADELGKRFGFSFTKDAFEYDAKQPIPLHPGG